MSFATLALLTTALVVGAYFLKFRQHKAFVSSLFLWHRTLGGTQHRALRERLRRLISAALALIIALLLVLAVARPQFWGQSPATRMVIVMDTSPTMLAQVNGASRWDHAVASVDSLLRGRANLPVRLADTSGRFDSSFTVDRRAIRQLLGRMSPGVSPLRFPDIDPQDSEVYFISDRVADLQPPPAATILSVFEPGENVGITAFQILAAPSAPLAFEAWLEVHNYGRESREAEIELSNLSAGSKAIVRKIRLAAGELFKESFDLSEFAGGGIRAVLRAGVDAFPLDDTAYGYIPIRKKVRTLLVTEGNKALERALTVNPLADVVVISPKAFREAPDYDTYVFDRFAPAAAPSRPSLIIGAPDSSWLPRPAGVVSHPEIKSWAQDHAVMQYVSLRDFAVERAARVDASSLLVLAASDSAPLIVASETPKWVLLTFTLESSDFPSRIGFPVFIDNVLGWLRSELPTLYRYPGLVEIPLADAQIVNQSGETVASRGDIRSTVFMSREPGLYRATQGAVHQYIAVNLASREYSDINRQNEESHQAAAHPAKALAGDPWMYLLAAVFVLLVVEWLTFHRSVTL